MQAWANKLAAADDVDGTCTVVQELFLVEDIPYGGDLALSPSIKHAPADCPIPITATGLATGLLQVFLQKAILSQLWVRAVLSPITDTPPVLLCCHEIIAGSEGACARFQKASSRAMHAQR